MWVRHTGRGEKEGTSQKRGGQELGKEGKAAHGKCWGKSEERKVGDERDQGLGRQAAISFMGKLR